MREASKDAESELYATLSFLAGRVVPVQARHMRKAKQKSRPGQLFIDRYMPDASEEEREAAYENLRGLITILVEIDDRLAREHREGDSRNRPK